jgi:lysophospholipase L1-like esterase
MNEKAWEDAVAFQPDIAIIKLGTNDTKPQNWQYGDEFKKDLEQMIAKLNPKRTKIILCTPLPAFKQ